MLLHPSSKGFSMVTEYLLENGAIPNHANQLGVTPLIAAARRGKKEVVRVLLQHGADVNPISLEVRPFPSVVPHSSYAKGIHIWHVS